MQDNEYLKMSALNAFRAAAPIDTGNLRNQSIFVKDLGQRAVSDGIVREFEIYVDDKIAPYAVYTNEEWISPKWNGKKNPNEGWVERGVENITFALAQILGGDITAFEGFAPIDQDTFVYEAKIRRKERAMGVR